MVKVYKKRFLMLFLMCLTNCLIMFQSFQYTSISHVVIKYYQVSEVAVTFTTISGNIAFLVFVYFGVLILEKGGIRVALTFAAFFNWLGALIKCFSLQRARFDVLLVGQTVAAIGQITSMPLPPLLASIWFANNETATVVGVNFGCYTLAVALTFVVSTVLFADSENVNSIENDLKTITIVVTIVTSICAILVLLFFRDKPKTPPSIAQQCRVQSGKDNSSLKLLFTNIDYNCLLIAFIFNYSVENTLTVVLNQTVRSVFGDNSIAVTISGTLLMICGIIGAIIVPILLDKFKTFKLISIICYILSIIALIAILTSIWFEKIIALYISIVFFGFFVYGFASIASDIVVDVTYPFPESTSAGVMYSLSSLIGIILAPTTSSLIETIGIYYTLILLIVLLSIGGVSLFCAKWNLKRKSTEENNVNEQQIVYSVDNPAFTLS
ncbi:putative MFS-type transporter C09D4.1-like isoform X4 [Leptotrombidium deliense]|uniref:Putative MFS-type transporter C09D4.1-like isoform X4 n=1 Tax=Leptotrombidium deliense TaxID=299467 RepID=A0A443S961_9ACAR|nr:putative MFS-type transporter C09D4.1-like isoform X4 [Leptotrombidium deliense]